MTFTQQQIEQWLSDLGKEAESREYADAYKFGFQMALVAVRCRIDDARKAAKDNHMHGDLVLTAWLKANGYTMHVTLAGNVSLRRKEGRK